MTEQETLFIFAGIFGAIQAIIELAKLWLGKHFGLEKQVSNHLQHTLSDMKECDLQNSDKIVSAIEKLGDKIQAMHLDLVDRIKR